MRRKGGYNPKAQPRRAKGGIKAQSRDFGETWWAKRWIGVLESFNIGARLSRGRTYARRGQVLSIEVAKGKIIAKVQGSRPQPYTITIEIEPLPREEWKRLARAFSTQALYAAKLLAGEMPREIEDVFRRERLSLFPSRLDEIKTQCTCPDWSNPCKHIAAVYYLLGEEFDRDPFIIFRLRGVTRDELAAMLGKSQPPQAKAKPKPAVEPLPSDPVEFWRSGSSGAMQPLSVAMPSIPAALPKRLGRIPFWTGSRELIDVIEQIYQRASILGSNLVWSGGGSPPEN
ncbi:MAG: SWIM zinc finger family protein [Bryobacteraceae bacterium]